jgi:hypothetical protein
LISNNIRKNLSLEKIKSVKGRYDSTIISLMLYDVSHGMKKPHIFDHFSSNKENLNNYKLTRRKSLWDGSEYKYSLLNSLSKKLLQKIAFSSIFYNYYGNILNNLFIFDIILLQWFKCRKVIS